MKKNIEVRELIKSERERQGISQRKLGRMAGCSGRIIALWEKGERKAITVDLADRILKVLNLSVTIGKQIEK